MKMKMHELKDIIFFIGKTSLIIQICVKGARRGGCEISDTDNKKNPYDIEVHCLASVV